MRHTRSSPVMPPLMREAHEGRGAQRRGDSVPCHSERSAAESKNPFSPSLSRRTGCAHGARAVSALCCADCGTRRDSSDPEGMSFPIGCVSNRSRAAYRVVQDSSRGSESCRTAPRLCREELSLREKNDGRFMHPTASRFVGARCAPGRKQSIKRSGGL